MFEFLNQKRVNIEIDQIRKTILIPRSKRLESIIRNRIFKPETLISTRAMFKSFGDIEGILDIGANVGYQALHYLYATGITNICSFEPSALNYRLLQRNVDGTGIKTFNFGLGDVIELREMSMPSVRQNPRMKGMKDNTGMLSLYGESPKFKETVQLTTLEQWVADTGRTLENYFIKIDVEGHELSVLKGGESALKGNNVFQIELNPASLAASGVSSSEVLKLMTVRGFKSFVFKDGRFSPYETTELKDGKVVDVIFSRCEYC